MQTVSQAPLQWKQQLWQFHKNLDIHKQPQRTSAFASHLVLLQSNPLIVVPHFFGRSSLQPNPPRVPAAPWRILQVAAVGFRCLPQPSLRLDDQLPLQLLSKLFPVDLAKSRLPNFPLVILQQIQLLQVISMVQKQLVHGLWSSPQCHHIHYVHFLEWASGSLHHDLRARKVGHDEKEELNVCGQADQRNHQLSSIAVDEDRKLCVSLQFLACPAANNIATRAVKQRNAEKIYRWWGGGSPFSVSISTVIVANTTSDLN